MREYKSYDSRPSADDAPDDCQYNVCKNNPRYYVKFRAPDEYVCYCTEHADEVYSQPTAKVRSILR